VGILLERKWDKSKKDWHTDRYCLNGVHETDQRNTERLVISSGTVKAQGSYNCSGVQRLMGLNIAATPRVAVYGDTGRR